MDRKIKEKIDNIDKIVATERKGQEFEKQVSVMVSHEDQFEANVSK